MQEQQMLEARPDLKKIQDRYNIEKERFIRGVIFAEFIVNGENATNSYQWAFEVDTQVARMNAATLRNTKWVQEIIIALRPDENTLYVGEIRQIIRKGMAIIDNPHSEPKDVISAINALAKYVKVAKPILNEEETVASDAINLITGLVKGIEDLANGNKMIDKHGDIIDVPILK